MMKKKILIDLYNRFQNIKRTNCNVFFFFFFFWGGGGGYFTLIWEGTFLSVWWPIIIYHFWGIQALVFKLMLLTHMHVNGAPSAVPCYLGNQGSGGEWQAAEERIQAIRNGEGVEETERDEAPRRERTSRGGTSVQGGEGEKQAPQQDQPPGENKPMLYEWGNSHCGCIQACNTKINSQVGTTPCYLSGEILTIFY